MLLVECQNYVQVDLWKRKAEILEMEIVVAFENLELCLEKWAFARFHPPRPLEPETELEGGMVCPSKCGGM